MPQDRQTASPSSATTISAWSVVRSWNTYAFIFHGVVIGLCYIIGRGDLNLYLGTEYSYTNEQSLFAGMLFSFAILIAIFFWKRTPAYLGGGYESK